MFSKKNFGCKILCPKGQDILHHFRNLGLIKSPSKHNTKFVVAVVAEPATEVHVEVKRGATTVRATTPGVVGRARQEATTTATIASIKSTIIGRIISFLINIINTIYKWNSFTTFSFYISATTKAITF